MAAPLLPTSALAARACLPRSSRAAMAPTRPLGEDGPIGVCCAWSPLLLWVASAGAILPRMPCHRLD
eukprot:14740507-Alexandrium_andersonii.AAC.1